jgi:hypothetical protein
LFIPVSKNAPFGCFYRFPDTLTFGFRFRFPAAAAEQAFGFP